MTYTWTPALRDALIELEVQNIVTSFVPADVEAPMIASMTALASIPLNSTLEPTGDEVEDDGDLEPAPTWAWVNQLIQFYYGNHTLIDNYVR